MKKSWMIAVLLVGLIPAVTMAGSRYDRGDRYVSGRHGYHGGSSSNSFFGINFGFGGGGSYGGFGYNNYSYPRYGPAYYPNRYHYAPQPVYVNPAPVYVAPAPVVVYPSPAYCPPPAVVYPAPSSYYYTTPRTYINGGGYYYSR